MTHSEFNASETEPVHFLQIWIEPSERGTEPRYGQKEFDWDERTNRLVPIVSGDGRDGSLVIGQDAVVLSGRLEDGVSVEQEVPEGRVAWLHVVKGELSVDGESLTSGDAAAFVEPGSVELTASGGAEVLWFDLAG